MGTSRKTSRRASTLSRRGHASSNIATSHLNSAPRDRRRLRFESLEDRRMLAVFTVSNLNDSGSGSLRSVIDVSNSFFFLLADTINFSVAGTINVLSQLPTIAGDLTINGNDLITLDAGDGADGTFNTGDGHRIFNIDDGNASHEIDVEFRGLTITGGDVTADVGEARTGGAIRSLENLKLISSTLSGNAASFGGAISHRYGALEVISSTISENHVRESGGGIQADSGTVNVINSTISGNSARRTGGIYNFATLNITSSTISGNTSVTNGGAIHNAGTATINSSTLSGNQTSSASGGAILNRGTATITINSSTLSGNQAFRYGGGIYNLADGTLTVSNSTIAQNLADASFSGGGGGIFNRGTATINSSTLSGNQANSGGGIYNRDDGTLTVSNSTIAQNLVVSPFSGGGGGIFNRGTTTLTGTIVGSSLFSTDIDGTVTANFSLIHDITDTTIIGANNILSQNPRLGSLADNGGSTLTHAFSPGSPAINAGDPSITSGLDQRGLDRVQFGRTDIGAVEFQPEIPPQGLVVSTTSDFVDYNFLSLTLREAILIANEVPGADTITFGSLFDTARVINIGSQLPTISDPLTIAGPGAELLTLDARSGTDRIFDTGDGYRLFDINDSNVFGQIDVEFRDLTITGGDVGGGTGDGGAILSRENLTLVRSTLSGNAADDVGGVISTSGTLNVINSTLSGNAANHGGAINSTGSVNITGSTLSGNAAGIRAGGIANYYGALNITGSTLAGNSAGNYADSIYADDTGPVTITGSIVAGSTLTPAHDILGNVTANRTLIQDAAGGVVNGLNNIVADPLLGPLADNGGATQTHALLPGSPAIDAGPVNSIYDYRLDTFADSQSAGIDLTTVGGDGTLSGGIYGFGTNQGLETQIPAANADSYSIELYFKFDNLPTGYHKILDFSTETHPDAGLYVNTSSNLVNRLRYFVVGPNGFYTSSTNLSADTWYHLVLTRDNEADNPLRSYIDGQLQTNYTETFQGHTLGSFTAEGDSSATKVVQLFHSDTSFGQQQGGAVDRVRFYDHPLSGGEVADLFDVGPNTIVPDFDQRGVPRQAGMAIDIGAYEAQVTPSADFDFDGDVDGADFLHWQRGFGTANAMLADGNSDDDTDTDASDLAAWKVSLGQTQPLSAVSSQSSVAGVDVVAPLSATAADLRAADLIDAAIVLALDNGSGRQDSDASDLLSHEPTGIEPTVMETAFAASEAAARGASAGVSDAAEWESSHKIAGKTATLHEPWLANELLERVFG